MKAKSDIDDDYCPFEPNTPEEQASVNEILSRAQRKAERYFNCITIYTDASVCSETFNGGWACWIKYGAGKSFAKSGAFKNKVKTSTEAELRAIANAITVAINTLDISEYNMIVVVTDSAQAIHRISIPKSKHMKSPSAKANKELAEYINGLIPKGIALKVNKVKAHSNKDGKRSYVNNLVDLAAKAHMRNARKQQQGTGQ